jgi:hypothetical protein
MNEHVKPRRGVEPRLLQKKEAAAYCGVCPSVFDQACPVQPLKLLDRIPRWDRYALDAWIDGLAKSETDELDPLKVWHGRNSHPGKRAQPSLVEG